METDTPVISVRARFAALVTFAAAYIYVAQGDFYFSLTAFTVLFFLAAGLMAEGKPFTRECAFFYGCTALLLVSVEISENLPAAYDSAVFSCELRVFFLHLAAVYAVLVRLGGLEEGKTGVYAPLDFFCGFILYPFGNFFRRPKILFSGYRKKSAHETVVSVLAALGGLLLIFGAFSLLREAGERFGTFFTLPDEIHPGEYVLYFALSLPVGAYLFGLMLGASDRRPATDKLKTFPAACRAVSVALWEALLGLFISVAALYFILEAPGIRGLLVDGISPAMQARESFFALTKVIALAVVLLALCRLTLKEESRAVSAMKTAVLVCCFLFGLTALATLLKYIILLGWTVRRASALWLITVLLAGTVLYERYLATGKSGFRGLCFFTAGSAALLSLLPYSLLH